MDDLTDLLREVHRSDSIVVPYTSHGRLKSWVRERFFIKNRRYFWFAIVCISICLICSSGALFSTLMYALLNICAPAFPDNKHQIWDWVESTAATLSKISPFDNFFRVLYAAIDTAVRQPGSEQNFAILGIAAVAIWAVVLSRFLRIKSDFTMAEDGLALVWHRLFASAKGPVVPWSEITGITLRTTVDNAGADGFIDFVYAKPRWQYKLGQSATQAKENKFSLDLRNLDTLEQRHAVGKAIEKWAPPNTVQPEVIENLSAIQSQTYTELWLQALTAPSKRQSLEPLPNGKKLQGGKYEIHSQLAVGGQGTAYLAESAEPIAGFPVVKLNDIVPDQDDLLALDRNEPGLNTSAVDREGTGLDVGTLDRDGTGLNAGVLDRDGTGLNVYTSKPQAIIDLKSQDSYDLPIEHSPDKADHVIRLDSANIVVKEFVLPLFVDANSRKDALRKFLDEADLLKRLNHDRVVKLSDCFVEDHRGYLVLERIYGNSLHQIVLKDGPFTEGRVLGLLDQMLDVLSYLHSQVPPVVHRDFAPDNLILGKDGVLKLVDFNVAQQAENSVVGTIVGKQSYVPPEQLRGMVTPASDIYALGATLYFLLTAQNPEPLSVSHPIDIVPHISKEIDQLVAGCTRLDEADRFKSVGEIRDFIENTLKWHDQKL